MTIIKKKEWNGWGMPKYTLQISLQFHLTSGDRDFIYNLKIQKNIKKYRRFSKIVR